MERTDAQHFAGEMLGAFGELFLVLDMEETIVGWNRAALDILGRSEQEMEAAQLSDLLPATERETVSQTLEQMQVGTSVPLDTAVVDHTGKSVDLSLTAAIHGDPPHIYLKGQARRKAEAERPAGQQRYRELFDAARDGIAIHTPEGEIIDINRAGLTMLGYSKEELEALDTSDIYPYPQQAKEGARIMEEEGQIRNLEVTLRRKDGEEITCLLSSTAQTDETGKIDRYFTLFRDITDRKQYQEQFRLMVREVKDYAIFVLDEEGRIKTWNEGAEKIKGYRREEILGEHLSTFYTEKDRRAGIPEQALAEAHARGRVENEGWRVRKDGSRFWARATLTALNDDQGRLRGYAKVTRDLTEEQEREQQLRASKERYRRLFEESRDAVILTAPEGDIIDVNTSALELFGYSGGAFLTMDASDLYADPEERGTRILPELLDSESASLLEAKMRRQDDSTFLASASVTVHRDEEGNPELIQALVRDITRQRRLEQQLVDIQEAERRRIGQELHDGIASQLNGVSMIGSSLTQALEEGEDITPSDLRELTRLVRESARQTRLLSQGLNPIQMGEEGLPTALQQLAKRTEEKSGISCFAEIQDKDVRLDEQHSAHLFRIAQEAVTNAVRHASANRIEVSLSMQEDSLDLSIVDDGQGFSNQTDEEGGGLGMHTMRYRADLIGGDIEITERPECGTMVRCHIPYRKVAR